MKKAGRLIVILSAVFLILALNSVSAAVTGDVCYGRHTFSPWNPDDNTYRGDWVCDSWYRDGSPDDGWGCSHMYCPTAGISQMSSSSFVPSRCQDWSYVCTGQVGNCYPVGRLAINYGNCLPKCTPTTEVCDNLDNDCDGVKDEDLNRNTTCGLGICQRTVAQTCGIGIWSPVCVPGNASTEICNNLDDDCDNQTDEGCDDDNDDYCDSNMIYVNSTECPNGDNDGDDNNSLIHPNATEICDNLDNNQNRITDEGCDDDNDTYADENVNCTGIFLDGNNVIRNCANNRGDCNDTNPLINPATVWYLDSDGDGFGNAIFNVTQCRPPNNNYTIIDSDLNDSDNNTYPNATELCYGQYRGRDENQNTLIDEGCFAPLITIISPEQNGIYGRSGFILFNVSLNEAGRSCMYSVNGLSNITLSRDSPTSFSGSDIFSHGNYDAIVSCNDTDGWFNSTSVSFVIDALGPQIFISYPLNITYSQAITELNFNITESHLDSCWYSLNNGALNNSISDCNLQMSISNLSSNDGVNNWIVGANDTLGNSGIARVRFIVDRSGPGVIINSPTENQIFDINNVNVSFSITDEDPALCSCSYILDNGQNGSANCISGNIELTNLPEGARTITVFAADAVGNQNNATRRFIIDTLPPSIFILYPLPGNHATPVQGLNYSVTDSNYDSCWYSINEGSLNSSAVAAGTNFTAPVASEGNNGWILWCNDSAGNQESARTDFFVDSISPIISFITPPTEISGIVTNDSLIDINATASDGILGSGISSLTINLYNSGHELINYSSSASSEHSIQFNVLEGIYYFNATACDMLGNCGPTETRNITIDITPPSVIILSPNQNITNSSLLEVRISATEPYDSIWFFNGTGIQNYDLTPRFVNFNQGYNTIEAWANDSAGNLGYANFTFFVDSTRPIVSIISPEPGREFNFTNIIANYSISEDNPDSCLFTLDNLFSESIGCSSGSKELNSLSEGSHTINVFASDIAGNSASASRSFIIDLTSPVIGNITSPENGSYYNSSTIETGISTGGNASSCTYSIDSGIITGPMIPGENNSFIALLSNLTEGEHTIQFYCNDSAGNIINSSTSTFIIDLTAPFISIISPENGRIYPNITQLLNISARDNNPFTTWYNWQGSEVFYNSSTYVDFTSGIVNLTATAIDAAGNSNRTSISFNVIIPKRIIQSTIYGEYYPLNTTYEVRTTTVLNSTINISTISTNPEEPNVKAGIYDSVLQNCSMKNVTQVARCTCIDTIFEKSECIDLYADPSNITYSNATGSTVIDSKVLYSNATTSLVRNSTISYSHVGNSVIINSTVCYSTVINSSIISSYVCYSTIINSNITDSTVLNSTIDNSTIINSTIINSNITNSTITNSNITNSTVTNGNVTNNTICNGTIISGNFSYNADENGCANITDVVNFPPNAILSAPDSGIAGNELSFDGSASTDPNIPGLLNDTLYYEFSFGDGATASGSSISYHTYANAGSYNASLKVTDRFGAFDSESKIISVTPKGSSGGGGGGGSARSPSTGIPSEVVYLPNVTQMLQGYNILLKEKDVVKFLAGGRFHYMQVMRIYQDRDYIGIELRPTDQSAIIFSSTDKIFEITGDEFNDFYMRLHEILPTYNSLKGPYANVTLRLQLKPSEENPSNILDMESERERLLEEEARIALRNKIILSIIAGIIILSVAIAWVLYSRQRSAPVKMSKKPVLAKKRTR